MNNQRIRLIVILTAVMLFGATLLISEMRQSNGTYVFVPPGWYSHTTPSGSLILTRNENISYSDNTETLALGEQIDFSSVALDVPVDAWIARRHLNDPSLSSSLVEGTLSGHRTLRTEHETEAAGKMMDYYIFAEGRVYIFSLFPVAIRSTNGNVTQRNDAGIEALNAVAKSFANQL
jgi:hypothetical protein